MLVELKLRVFNAESLIDYLVKTGVFVSVHSLAGSGGAYLAKLRPIEGIAPFILVIEQPHHSRLENWKESFGYEVTLPCIDFEMLEAIYDILVRSGASVTEFFDRPWGGAVYFDNSKRELFYFF